MKTDDGRVAVDPNDPKMRLAADTWEKIKPKIYPPWWIEDKKYRAINGARYFKMSALAEQQIQMIVLATVGVERDDKLWLHVSASCRSRTPSYEELCQVKLVFVGRKRKAIQIFATEEEHVNIHPHCLHLWCCLDGDPLPDFRKNGEI